MSSKIDLVECDACPTSGGCVGTCMKTAPVVERRSVSVVLPERMTFEGNEPEPISISYDVAAGWNACLDKVKELNQ
jgi:hypothetical protein